jgi:hypothetical protein
MSSNNEKPYIVNEQFVNATLGKEIKLSCTVYNMKSYKIAWYLDGVLLTLNKQCIKNDKRYSIKNRNDQPNKWTLVINPVASNNQGFYTCQLGNGLKKVTYLQVGIAPRFTIDTNNNETQKVVINTKENETIKLTCEADGNPKPNIYWYRNNKFISFGNYLIINNVTRHSPTDYECVARNTIEPDPSRNFKINVICKYSHYYYIIFKFIDLLFLYVYTVDPILTMKHNLKQNLNYSDDSDAKGSKPELQIYCEILGNPINSIHWLKDGLKIKNEIRNRKSNLNQINNVRLALIPNKNNNNNATRNEIEIIPPKKTVHIHTIRLNAHMFLSKVLIQNYDDADNGLYQCIVNGNSGVVNQTVLIKGNK